MMEQRIDQNSVAAHMHDLLGFALEVSLCFDQLDISNLAGMEVISRAYQLVEETSGSLQVEGLEHYIGRGTGSGLKKGIALAPSLAKHATDKQGQETLILKERRKAKEEKAAAAANPKGGGKHPHKQ